MPDDPRTNRADSQQIGDGLPPTVSAALSSQDVLNIVIVDVAASDEVVVSTWRRYAW